MAFGNLALDLILDGTSGRLVNIRNGVYGSISMEVISGPHKVVDVEKFYNPKRLRPNFKELDGSPLFIMNAD